MQDFDDVNKKTTIDVAVALARIGVGGIPIAGPALVEYMNLFLGNPLEARRDEWFREFAERMAWLEQNRGISLIDLQQDSNFMDAVYQTFPEVIRTTVKARREAFKNALTNIAMKIVIEDVKQQYFIRLIQSMNEGHLLILNFLNDSSKIMDPNKQSIREKAVDYTIWGIFHGLHPGLLSKDTLLIILEELINFGLLVQTNIDGLNTMPFYFGTGDVSFTSKRGQDFLRFVTFNETDL